MAAQFALGLRYEASAQTALARNWLAHAARAGNVEAARRLGISLLTQEPIQGPAGVAVIADAQRRGDAEAAYISGMLAAQDPGVPRRFEIALGHIRDAAARGFARAGSELALLGDAVDLEGLSSALPVQEVSTSPRIATIADCAPPAICDWLIAQTAPRLDRAKVYDPQAGGARTESARSNRAAEFNVVQSSLVLMLLRQRIAATAGLSFDCLETPQILHYAVGQEFKPHFDFLDRRVPGHARDVDQRGQRVATFLIYLNDSYEGGETEFPRLGIKHKARKGAGLLFWNVDSEGQPDRRMLHTGLPPIRGEKWVLSQWLRERRS